MLPRKSDTEFSPSAKNAIGSVFWSSGHGHGKSDALPFVGFRGDSRSAVARFCGGRWLRSRNRSAADEQNEDLGVILVATLTLLALIIGFTASMATNRYDQRKTLEEAEANAIGTELLRADLIPPADAANVRRLLGAYLDQRILFYINQDATRQRQIDQSTSQLQADLWAAVRGPAMADPTPVAAIVLSGMNDVINSQGYTQAAFWNRIPIEVWILMAAIAVCSNVLFGYRSRKGKDSGKIALVLPFVVRSPSF